MSGEGDQTIVALASTSMCCVASSTVALASISTSMCYVASSIVNIL